MRKKRNIESQFNALRVFFAIILSLFFTLLILMFTSNNPVNTLIDFLLGPLQSIRRMGNVIEMVIPLLFTGTGVCIMYAANQTNMASEGAFFLGGVGASYVASMLLLPSGIHPILSILIGGLIGAVVTTIPAIMYVKFKALPVVSSLMINYVCLYLGLYVINYVIRDPEAGYLASYTFRETSILPKLFSITNIHFGLIIAIFVVIFGHYFLDRSKWGYSIRRVGENPNFAKYSGINVNLTIIICQVIGGFIAGLGGSVEQLGMYNRFQYQRLPGYGFDGVVVAVLSRYRPKYVPIASVFLAYIRVAADVISRTSDVPVEIVSVIQAIIIMLVAAERFLAGWKQRVIVKQAKLLESESAVL